MGSEMCIRDRLLSVGVDIGYEVPSNNWSLRPFGKIEYTQNFTEDSNVDMNYINDSKSYRVTIATVSNSSWNTALGLDLLKKNDLSASLSYEREQPDSSFYSDSYQFQVNWNF